MAIVKLKGKAPRGASHSTRVARGTEPKKWTRVVNNKMKGLDGETDYNKKQIIINKKKSKTDKGFAKKDRTVINSIVHEEMHRIHPKMTEKRVRKNTRTKVAHMSSKVKKKMYSRYKS